MRCGRGISNDSGAPGGKSFLTCPPLRSQRNISETGLVLALYCSPIANICNQSKDKSFNNVIARLAWMYAAEVLKYSS